MYKYKNQHIARTIIFTTYRQKNEIPHTKGKPPANKQENIPIEKQGTNRQSIKETMQRANLTYENMFNLISTQINENKNTYHTGNILQE